MLEMRSPVLEMRPPLLEMRPPVLEMRPPVLEMRPPVHVLLCCVQVTQLTAQFDDIQSSAHEASEMMEGEQMEKREMEEKLQETMVRCLYHFQRVLVLTPPYPPSPHRHESQNFLGSMNSCTCRLLR